MFKISLTESIIIGIFTVLMIYIIDYLINFFTDNNRENFFHNRTFLIFLLFFVFGIIIHVLLTYIEFSAWECRKVCDETSCKILCSLPINEFTTLMITK